MKSKADPRHSARKLALSTIFCWLFDEQASENAELLSKELFEATEVDSHLTNYLVEGVKSNLDEIDKIIVECAPEWPLDKISKVDLVILRIAVFEVIFGKETPLKVAIDESIEMAKEFGNDTSHKFINGVLGTVVDKYLEVKDKKK
jgi:N utilization substance protein B